jgi:hypothetical protein
MKQIASFETAKKLEAAGFERPKIEVGQYWYTSDGRAYFICAIVGGEIFVKWICPAAYLDFIFKNNTDWIYAPNATDLLKVLGSDFVVWFDKSPKLQMWYCAKCGNCAQDAGTPFGDENAAEAVAEAFLSQ